LATTLAFKFWNDANKLKNSAGTAGRVKAIPRGSKKTYANNDTARMTVAPPMPSAPNKKYTALSENNEQITSTAKLISAPENSRQSPVFHSASAVVAPPMLSAPNKKYIAISDNNEQMTSTAKLVSAPENSRQIAVFNSASAAAPPMPLELKKKYTAVSDNNVQMTSTAKLVSAPEISRQIAVFNSASAAAVAPPMPSEPKKKYTAVSENNEQMTSTAKLVSAPEISRQTAVFRSASAAVPAPKQPSSGPAPPGKDGLFSQIKSGTGLKQGIKPCIDLSIEECKQRLDCANTGFNGSCRKKFNDPNNNKFNTSQKFMKAKDKSSYWSDSKAPKPKDNPNNFEQDW
jgi:hypothetical protein